MMDVKGGGAVKDVRERTYIAIDLKSFYASSECIARGRDPLTTHLVVADESRTEKTICLAVSPSLKAYGIPGRARLFEVNERVRAVNAERRMKAPGHRFTGKSDDEEALARDPSLELSFIAAVPRMGHYMRESTKIYEIYLRYVAPEDIHVYSIDEVFIDATEYLNTYGLTPHDFAMKLIRAVLQETGITATAGIGTNLYLAKIAMDIVAKHIPADENGVRIAELDAISYRRSLWNHTPLTDFWRVGRGISERLHRMGLNTMGDIARCSLTDEERLYREFGVNAELLIDHAWGEEPCTIAEVKAFRPENNSINSGQVLPEPYSAEKARLVVSEMTDAVSLDLVEKGLVTDQLVLTVGYDIENLKNKDYKGEITDDFYGRKAPKMAHGSVNLGGYTSSAKRMIEKMRELYDRIVDPMLTIRRMYVVANHLKDEAEKEQLNAPRQFSLFEDPEEQEKKDEKAREAEEKEKRLQQAMIRMKNKYGKNAVLKGMNLEKGARAAERNRQVGGHRE